MMTESAMATSAISQYRLAINDLIDNLSAKELKRVKLLCKDFLSKRLRETGDDCDVIEALETGGHLSEDHHEILMLILSNIHREDLKKRFLQRLNSVKFEGPKNEIRQSLSEVLPSTEPPGNSRRGPAVKISGDGQSTQSKSLARSCSLQGDPTGQSSHEAAYLRGPATSVGKDPSAECAPLSLQQPPTSGSPGSGFESAKKEQPGDLAEFGREVKQMLEQLYLQGSGQLAKPTKGSELRDEDDIETDSSLPVIPSSETSQLSSSWSRGPATAVDCRQPDQREDHREPVREISFSHRFQKPLFDLSTDSSHTETSEIAEDQPGNKTVHPSTPDLEKTTVHCKKCSVRVCQASELRQMGGAGHVTCISPDFMRWVKEVRYSRPLRSRESETVGLISCGGCGTHLGTILKLLKVSPQDGYALKAESFQIHFEKRVVMNPKMWKKAGFPIPPLIDGT